MVMKDQPIYYRWAFNPEDASVTLSHNGEDHPAFVRYHGDLQREIGRNDTHHGYAYRIGGGWRLTDWEHDPVHDKYVAAQVLRKLREEEGPHNPHPHLDDWTVQEEPGYDKFHYGLPQS